MGDRKVNSKTGYDIRDISIWYDAYGLSYRLGKGDYLIMGIDKGSSLNLNIGDFVIYSTDTDFYNIVKAGIKADDLILVKDGNSRDQVRPHTVRCNSKETLRLLMPIYAQNPSNREWPIEEDHKTVVYNEDSSNKKNSKVLFERLKALRLDISREESLPAFCVFSNEVLVDLADKQPITKLDMLNIKGIGESKYIKYGERFLDVIRNFKKQGMSEQEDPKVKYDYNPMHEVSTRQQIQNQLSRSNKPVATLKKTQQDSIKKIAKTSSVKKKREQYTMDDETYYLMNGKWVDSQFTTVSKEEMYKLNAIRIKNINFDDIEISKLIKMAQEMKDSDDYIFSKKLFDTIFERCSDKEVVRSILSRYTSILRNLEQPEEAIEVAEKYISLYGKYVYTPALFTSLAGAYCDIGDYVEARKKANVAKAMSGENASLELINVYARIKSMEK